MTIDPRFSVILSICLAILAYLSGASATLTTLVGDADAKAILAIVSLILGVGNSINAVLGAMPSKPGDTSKFWLAPTPTNTPQAPKP